MLSSLSITNFALIESLEVRFRYGLTVVTGETGAGKSIVVDALSLALGERADTTMVRDGAAKAVIEATFETDNDARIQTTIEELGADTLPELILRREISAKGVSRCFVNDTPVSVSDLKRIGDAMVDIHGQHEHQSLLHPETHIAILDAFAGNEALLERYRQAWKDFIGCNAEWKKARHARDEAEDRKAVIERRLKDIDEVDPKTNEDEEIKRELNIAEHAEKIAALCSETLRRLYDDEQNVIGMLGDTRKALHELSAFDAVFEPLYNEAESAMAGVNEIVRTLRGYTDGLDYNPQKLESLRERLMTLTGLKRKFSMSLAELIQHRQALKAERDSIENIDDVIQRLEREAERSRSEASALAAKLHQARKAASPKLGKAVEDELASLGMAKTRFVVVLEMRTSKQSVASSEQLLDGKQPMNADDRGWDEVEFHLSANIGEEPKPLAKVISGGEASRVMLALKTIFASKEAVPVLIFDEIDAGISGRVAQRVGQAMRRLAARHQIFAITHLPQIAATGTEHFVVEKTADGGRTRTTLRKVENGEREEEIARLISGETVSPTTLQTAKELLSGI